MNLSLPPGHAKAQAEAHKVLSAITASMACSSSRKPRCCGSRTRDLPPCACEPSAVWAVAIGRSPIGVDSDMRLEIGRPLQPRQWLLALNGPRVHTTSCDV